MQMNDRALDQAFFQVMEFHRAFGHPFADKPAQLSPDRINARAEWMREEIRELEEATDLVDQADAVIDLMYFAIGTMVEMGVKPQHLFEIVHQANMEKLWPDGQPRYREDGKVRKPEGWRDPKTRLIEALQAEVQKSVGT
jgi:predicted HAD superfamily Cof-like phosphohydrolase